MDWSKVNQENMYKELNDMRHNGQLCDVKLSSESPGGKHFPVHSAVIAGCSPYFRKLFNNPTLSLCATKRRSRYKIAGVTTEDLENIINYAYTGEINLGPGNIETLLPAADMLHVIGVVKECCEYLKKNFCVENCIGIYNFAEFYSCLCLAKAAKKYVLAHFDDVAKSSVEFLQLSADELKTFCEDDELNVKDEESLFNAIMRWVEYSEEERNAYLANILPTVRYGHINSEFFENAILNHSFITRYSNKNSNCNAIMDEAWHILNQIQEHGIASLDCTNPLVRPRVPHDVLFVVGGWSAIGTSITVETYDVKADRWYHVKESLPSPRAYHGVIAHNNRIYVIGGYDGSRYQNSVQYYDPSTATWHEVAPMYNSRCYVSVTELDGLVYACGGYDGRNRQFSAERYDPDKNQWTIITPMHHKRSDADATSLDGKVYIAGGFDGHVCLNSIECYDPTKNQWTVLKEMTKRRSGLGVIALNGNLFCVGGYDGNSRLESIERYNPLCSEWREVTDMSVGRSNFALEAIDGMLFVIGGYDGQSISSVVECYDMNSNTWYDASDLNISRSATSACVIRGLDNARKYTFYGNMDLLDDNVLTEAESIDVD